MAEAGHWCLREDDIAEYRLTLPRWAVELDADMRRIDLVVEYLGQFQRQIMITKNRSGRFSADQHVVMETDAAGALEKCFARVVDQQIAVDLIEIVRARALLGKAPTNKFGRLPSGEGRLLFLKTLFLMIVACGPSGRPGSVGRAIWYLICMP